MSSLWVKAVVMTRGDHEVVYERSLELTALVRQCCPIDDCDEDEAIGRSCKIGAVLEQRMESWANDYAAYNRSCNPLVMDCALPS